MNIVEILEKHQNWCNSVANGERANLRGANFLVLMLPIWTVYIHKQTVRIGCKHYTHDEWLAFSDSEIHDMDSKALGWWKQYKPVIEAGINTLKDVEK